jgi:hypothetical protein
MKIFELADNLQYATKGQTKELAQNLGDQMPQFRFEPQKKAVSPVNFIRVFNANKSDMIKYFKDQGLDSLPLEPEQAGISGKYRGNILSYDYGGTVYTLVVASSGNKEGDDTGVSVSIKEFTPTALGLAGKTYNKVSLLKATRSAVKEKTKTRPELQQILLSLLDIAESGKGQLTPELNNQLSDRARDQLSVDFGEILAPILIAEDKEEIDFPAEGNFPLVDVIVGGRNYSVKSLTGSGTSFKSISDLMDSYEKTIEKDDKQKQLYSLFKGFHPTAGGKNVDKILKAAALVKIPEYTRAASLLGGNFDSYSSLQNLLTKVVTGNTAQDYGKFLNFVYPVMTAGGWDKPVGLPADGKYYMGDQQGAKPVEKEAGFPSFRANPVKAATDILTYALGVGTLNAVTKGKDAEKYSQMMTKIVNQSSAYLGKLDITNQGSLRSSSKPFSDLQFKFQYHAPSHKPGNNLPGFMIVF